MTPLKRDYYEALLHLRRASELMNDVMELSDDWMAKVDVRAEFRQLHVAMKDFGRYQLGWDVPCRKPGRKGFR